MGTSKYFIKPYKKAIDRQIKNIDVKAFLTVKKNAHA
jgi:hypothetical protein